MALILYKNNIQLDDTTYQPARMMFALILYKNNIQQQFFAVYEVFYYKNRYKYSKIQ